MMPRRMTSPWYTTALVNLQQHWETPKGTSERAGAHGRKVHVGNLTQELKSIITHTYHANIRISVHFLIWGVLTRSKKDGLLTSSSVTVIYTRKARFSSSTQHRPDALSTRFKASAPDHLMELTQALKPGGADLICWRGGQGRFTDKCAILFLRKVQWARKKRPVLK